MLKFLPLSEDAVLPYRGSPHAAGLDLTATRVEYDRQNDRLMYHTDLAVEIPEGRMGLLVPRSSCSKKDLHMPHSVGIIDSDYRGEILVVYRSTNMSSFEATDEFPTPSAEAYHAIQSAIEERELRDGDEVVETAFGYVPGERIAQLIIVPVDILEPIFVETLSKTERGEGGFGSTGQVVDDRRQLLSPYGLSETNGRVLEILYTQGPSTPSQVAEYDREHNSSPDRPPLTKGAALSAFQDLHVGGLIETTVDGGLLFRVTEDGAARLNDGERPQPVEPVVTPSMKGAVSDAAFRAVCRVLEITKTEVCCATSGKDIPPGEHDNVQATREGRRLFVGLLAAIPQFSQSDIARILGCDHSTIHYHRSQHQNLVVADAPYLGLWRRVSEAFEEETADLPGMNT